MSDLPAIPVMGRCFGKNLPPPPAPSKRVPICYEIHRGGCRVLWGPRCGKLVTNSHLPPVVGPAPTQEPATQPNPSDPMTSPPNSQTTEMVRDMFDKTAVYLQGEFEGKVSTISLIWVFLGLLYSYCS